MVLNITMKIISFILLSLTLLSCSNTEVEVMPIISKVEAPASGIDIYNRYCVVCHGDKGDGKIGGALDLSISSLTAGERFHIIKNGSKNKHMRAFGDDLTDPEIKAVAKHLEILLK